MGTGGLQVPLGFKGYVRLFAVKSSHTDSHVADAALSELWEVRIIAGWEDIGGAWRSSLVLIRMLAVLCNAH